jgi:LmbE family N-acetylglucosaminyl deacetylase
VTRIGEDARFDAKLTKTDIPGQPHYPKRIIYYFCTHLRLSFQPTFCIDISAQLETKIRAIGAYESQFGHDRAIPTMVRTMNEYFGGRIGTAAAEPFFTHEVLGLGGLDQLI